MRGASLLDHVRHVLLRSIENKPLVHAIQPCHKVVHSETVQLIPVVATLDAFDHVHVLNYDGSLARDDESAVPCAANKSQTCQLRFVFPSIPFNGFIVGVLQQ